MSSSSSANTKRIAKNTFFLYLRMAFLIVITLYTSRVVLDKLGVEDFGIYNVVGGLAGMFVFFQSSLANATQRFLNVELARGSVEGAQKVYSQNLLLYGAIVAVVLVLGETVGTWFVWNKLVIPPERFTAAFWVCQFTLLSLCASFVGVVYNSAIIAHEDMKVYSYVGVFDGLAKLAVAFLISVTPADRLLTYGFLLLLTHLLTQVFYFAYCRRHYAECRFRYSREGRLLREMGGMIGWNTVGTAVYAINDAGVNVLLNMFFGPLVNAARAVSMQVNNAVANFANNLIVAARPQMVTSYAKGDFAYLIPLFFRTSKFSYFMLFVMSLPFYFSIDGILALWLKEVPAQSGLFTLLVLATALVNVISNPIWTLALASGRLRRYICTGSLIYLMAFPASYVVLRMGCPPVSVFATLLIARALSLACWIWVGKSYVPYGLRAYARRVLLPIALVTIASSLLCRALHSCMPEGLPGMFLHIGLCILVTAAVVFALGMDASERQFVLAQIRQRL